MTLTGNDEASALTLPHATWATIRQLASTFSLTPSQVVERSVVAAQLTIDSFGCLPTAAERAQLSPATARQADATTALPAPGSEQQPSQPHSTPSTCPNEVEKFRQRRLRLQPQNNGKFKCDRCFRKRKRAEVKARNAALPEGVAKETVPPHSHKTCERLSAEDSFDGYACDTGMPEPDSTKLLPAGQDSPGEPRSCLLACN